MGVPLATKSGLNFHTCQLSWISRTIPKTELASCCPRNIQIWPWKSCTWHAY